MTPTVEPGSIWIATDRTKFVVISRITAQDGKIWVHYREEGSQPPKEYSCYEESFVQRFSEYNNYRYGR